MLPARDVDELIALAYRDDLTGLHNRRFFSQILTKPLEETPSPDPYCFLLLDIDFFKEINDTYGHRTGDRVLTAVARLLAESIDEGQTAVRYAGDEFILFLPNTDRDAGLRKANEIVETMFKLDTSSRRLRSRGSTTSSISTRSGVRIACTSAPSTPVQVPMHCRRFSKTALLDWHTWLTAG